MKVTLASLAKGLTQGELMFLALASDKVGGLGDAWEDRGLLELTGHKFSPELGLEQLEALRKHVPNRAAPKLLEHLDKAIEQLGGSASRPGAPGSDAAPGAAPAPV